MTPQHPIYDFVEQLKKLSVKDEDAIGGLIRSFNLTAKDLEGYECFDHPGSESYGRNLLYEDDHIEVIVMSWLPQDYSAIHDHGDVGFGIVQVYGEMIHHIYNVKQGIVDLTSTSLLHKEEIFSIPKNMIHQMGNEGDQPVLSLHIYCFDDKGEEASKIYDVVAGEVLHTNSGAFYCLSDDEVIKREYGINADADIVVEETFRKNHRRDKMKSN